eukprot:scaffold17198_cov119-Isochrysis_galbana.AAC.3
MGNGRHGSLLLCMHGAARGPGGVAGGVCGCSPRLVCLSLALCGVLRMNHITCVEPRVRRKFAT